MAVIKTALIIMELVEGKSLQERLHDGPLDQNEAIEVACQLCDGLSIAHELGIIHRDIKPGNILLTARGKPKLTDFGLARQDQADHGHTMTGAVLGTVDFMPPEQRRDATQVDCAERSLESGGDPVPDADRQEPTGDPLGFGRRCTTLSAWQGTGRRS